MFGSKLKVTLNAPDCGLSNRTFTYLHLSFLQSCEADMEGKWSECLAHWLFIVSVESFKWEKRLGIIWGMVRKYSCCVWKERTAMIMGRWQGGGRWVEWLRSCFMEGKWSFSYEIQRMEPRPSGWTYREYISTDNQKSLWSCQRGGGHGITWAFKQRWWEDSQIKLCGWNDVLACTAMTKSCSLGVFKSEHFFLKCGGLEDQGVGRFSSRWVFFLTCRRFPPIQWHFDTET